MFPGGATAHAAPTTCSINASPPVRCRTLARFDRMRVPRPAAKMTTVVFMTWTSVWSGVWAAWFRDLPADPAEASLLFRAGSPGPGPYFHAGSLGPAPFSRDGSLEPTPG